MQIVGQIRSPIERERHRTDQANWREGRRKRRACPRRLHRKWCGPCKSFAPIVNRLADRYKGKVKIAKFDVGDNTFDNARQIQAKYGFRGVPHVMIFKGGEEPVNEFPGGASESRLAGILDNLLALR